MSDVTTKIYKIFGEQVVKLKDLGNKLVMKRIQKLNKDSSHILVTHKGKTVAAIVSVHEYNKIKNNSENSKDERDRLLDELEKEYDSKL